MPKFPRTIEGLIERYKEQGPIPVAELVAMLPLQPESPLQFSTRELAAVLAGLRLWQAAMLDMNGPVVVGPTEGEHPCPVALAYCIDTHVFEHLGDSEENAKLIAAAPDLLEMLDNVSASLDTVLAWYGQEMTDPDYSARFKLMTEAREMVRKHRPDAS